MWQALQQSWAIARRRMPQARLHRSILSLGMLGALAILLSVLLAWQLPYGSQLLLKPDEIAPFTVMAPRIRLMITPMSLRPPTTGAACPGNSMK